MKDPDAAQGEPYDPEVEAMCRRLLSVAGVYRLRQERAAAAAGREGGDGPEKADSTKRTHAARPGAPECAAAHPPATENEPTAAANGAPGGAAVRGGPPWHVPAAPRERPGLEPRQVMAARMLLAGRRLTDVAAALGVDRHTVARWKRDPAFVREVRRMAVEMPMPGAEAKVNPPGPDQSA